MWQNPDDIDRYRMPKEFVFFREYHEAIKCMSLKDQAIVIKEVLDYMFEGIMPPEHNDIKGVFWFANYRNLRLSKTNSKKKSKEEQTDIKAISKSNQNQIKSETNQNQKSMPMNKDKDKDKDISSLPPKSPKGVDDGFDKFWEVYPNKKSKATARKAFKKVKVSLDVLISAVKKQSTWEQWQKDNGAFIPYAATWLNQCRWEDEEKVITNPGLAREEEYHELTPMTKCKLCGSRNVSSRGLFSNCLNCGQGFFWNGKDWKEEV